MRKHNRIYVDLNPQSRQPLVAAYFPFKVYGAQPKDLLYARLLLMLALEANNAKV